MKDRRKNQQKAYNPNVGFIGNAEVKVANYLFSAKRLRKSYTHSKPITDRLLKNHVSNHYSESKNLTKFLKSRDLTFSKKVGTSTEYKIFTVPCTTTIVPIEKSLFNDVEEAAQRLMISLRGVIQDIYGSKDLKSSSFVKSLPKDVRDIFIEAIQTSSNYFPQLHHPNMKKYPFLDNVGLDLVLVEDYLQKSDKFPAIIAKNKQDSLPPLPFRILEINAGSPSGASNNMNVLEGIYEQTPEILDSLGKMMPNDHFEILGETYKSLGDNWTGITDGVQVLLPPGGQNGAAPEIHQLAAYSGLIYADADQLYQDEKGFIRLRTVSEDNPIVTAIYSRINADSALYDKDKGLVMKDPDSAKPVLLRDSLVKDADGEGKVILDSEGNTIPMKSSYAIPGIIDAIIDKKIYMGGLNRILDNKIILATLTHYAPKYYAKKIIKAGLNPAGAKILPPQTLPPTQKSVDIILNNPDDWVVKAPSLAGGQGVYILKTMPPKEKEEVLKMIQERPNEFAYQQLVKIARIPVAVQRKAEGYKFANLAADIRTWVFFGGGENALPRMSHNALVRYAPQEKGRMSSIVNTSAGGGYAPFIIIDDINHKDAVTASELVKPKEPKIINTAAPVFVAAQMVQIARMLKDANRLLDQEHTYAYELLFLTNEMKKQLKEILSFLHPRSVGHIYKIIDMLETRVSKTETKEHSQFIADNQLKLVAALKSFDDFSEMKNIRDIIDNIRALNTDTISLNYSPEDRALDMVLVDDLFSTADFIDNKEFKEEVYKVARIIKKSVSIDKPNVLLGKITKNTIRKHLNNFCTQAKSRLEGSPKMAAFAELFDIDANVTQLRFETLYLGSRDGDREIRVGTQQEMRTDDSLVSDHNIAADLARARVEWKRIIALGNTIGNDRRQEFISRNREEHFGKFPRLKKFQEIIDSPNASKENLIELMEVVPYAKFNIEHFAKEQGVEVSEIFSNTITKDRLSILSPDQLKDLSIENREYAGECFAKKKCAHGLYSNSDIFIWLRQGLNPFVMLYTAGHELIHYQQIKNSMRAEKRALKDGGISIAKFLNYYGNFLGSNNRTIDSIEDDTHQNRKTLYGYGDRVEYETNFNKPVLKDLNNSLNIGDDAWEAQLAGYGSLFGYMLENETGTRVKALQEVLPALENAKNINFAKDLGLKINIDTVAAALPAASVSQVKYYSDEIMAACKSTKPIWESLRIIASHQYHGVTFYRADNETENLCLIPNVESITVGSSYNQTQQ